jgi:hypothetical protein
LIGSECVHIVLGCEVHALVAGVFAFSAAFVS